jgi:PKD repeat protein
MRKIYILLFLACSVLPALSQLNRADYTPRSIETYAFTQKNLQSGPMIVDSVSSVMDAINSLFGPGVTVSNLTYTGPNTSIGSFLDTSTVFTTAGDFGIDEGILLTTGNIADAPGPNSSTSMSTSNNLPGDADLNALIPGYFTYDASVIEFDFTPMTDTLIACNFIFASEEYLEWVNSSFNDVFGFFISGPGFIGLQNLATIQTFNSAGQTLDVPISVNSINDLTNSSYFILNEGDVVEYDGFTVPIELTHTITPGQQYHFKIAVADAGDAILDAAVFMESGSFLGYASVPVSNYTFAVNPNSTEVQFTNTTNYATSYLWNFGDGQTSTEASPFHIFDIAGTYEVVLEARNYYQIHTTTHTVIIPEIINSINTADNGPVMMISNLGNGHYIIGTESNSSAPVKFALYSSTGQLISSEFTPAQAEIQKEINLSGYAKGIYFLNVTDNNSSSRIKLMNP